MIFKPLVFQNHFFVILFNKKPISKSEIYTVTDFTEQFYVQQKDFTQFQSTEILENIRLEFHNLFNHTSPHCISADIVFSF